MLTFGKKKFFLIFHGFKKISSYFLFLVHTMDERRHKIPQSIFLNFLLFFGMGTGLGIYSKFKSPSTCEIWHFNALFFSQPFDSPSFRAFIKTENAFLLAITSWGFTKLTKLILELVKKNHLVTGSTKPAMSTLNWWKMEELQQYPQSIVCLPLSQNLNNKDNIYKTNKNK